MLKEFEDVINSEYLRQRDRGLLRNLSKEDNTLSEAIIQGNIRSPSRAFSKLAEMLYKSTRKKVIVLVDEYDTPIIDANEHNYMTEV